MHSRPRTRSVICSACRRRRSWPWPMAMRRPPASSRSSTCTSRPGSATRWACSTTRSKAGSPILVTAGQHEQSFTATEPILWADLPTIARPLVKWSAEVHRLADLPRLVHRAAKTALAPPTGPVFLSLPGDILRADGDVDLLGPTRVAPRLRGDRSAVEAAAARAGRRAASGDHGRRCSGAQPRPCRAGRACRASRRFRLHRVRAEHRVVSGLAPVVSRLDGAARAGGAQGAGPARRAVLRRRRPVHAFTAVRRRSDAARDRADPSRCRSLGARQELPARASPFSAIRRRRCRRSPPRCASA